jgi:hypothetical protein
MQVAFYGNLGGGASTANLTGDMPLVFGENGTIGLNPSLTDFSSPIASEPLPLSLMLGTTANSFAGPTGDAYSVAYQMQLDSAVLGTSRSVQFNRANAALDAALQSDPVFASQMEQLIPGVADSVSSVGGRATPSDYIWHHSTDTGIMQLVPEAQHTTGSIFWDTLHPGGRGGYSIWAIPAGAPKN